MIKTPPSLQSALAPAIQPALGLGSRFRSASDPAGPGIYNYRRPGGVDTYRRPGGVDTYKRPL